MHGHAPSSRTHERDGRRYPAGAVRIAAIMPAMGAPAIGFLLPEAVSEQWFMGRNVTGKRFHHL
ncbi:MAG: hypothetical protein CMJ42_07835 [Phyllobacteriaceae bacterium]|nr:hypothetical protein [Phyllobacteriaceae bacterium]MBA92423.1 hypothetical protein [Phyllobacteriaceae bacterium]